LTVRTENRPVPLVPWLPQRKFELLDRHRLIRRFGVSTLIIGETRSS
jgi:hypothetical protein